jgi:hypothetical protein
MFDADEAEGVRETAVVNGIDIRFCEEGRLVFAEFARDRKGPPAAFEVRL